jgi:6-phosphogluconolactonase
MQLVIGTYTESSHKGTGKGICLADFDSETGSVALRSCDSKIPNPSYVAMGENGSLFVASEMSPKGQVAGLTFSKNGFNELWRIDASGAATCHVTTCPTKQLVAVANYVSGTAKLVSATDGKTLAEWTYQGSGPNEKRQQSPHAHQALFSPSDQWLLVTDLGSDAIWVHAIKEDMTAYQAKPIKLPAGAGPRHTIFHQQLPVLYTISELDGKVYWGQWSEANGTCEWQGSIQIQTPDSGAVPHSSAIKLHPTLPLLYAADRARQEIAIFDIDDNGALRRNDHIAVNGEGPRDFTLSRDGSWLLIACQDSNTILSLPLNTKTGRPTGAAVSSNFESPVCLVFAH